MEVRLYAQPWPSGAIRSRARWVWAVSTRVQIIEAKQAADIGTNRSDLRIRIKTQCQMVKIEENMTDTPILFSEEMVKAILEDQAHPSESFRSLWNSIHGPHAWDQNPWVVAIKFEPVFKNILKLGAT